MSKRTLHTLALFFLGAAIGSGLYGVTSDSDSETVTLTPTIPSHGNTTTTMVDD